MTNQPSDPALSFRSEPLRASLEVVAKDARDPISMRDNEAAFELPGRLFEQLPFAIYICDQAGLVLRYNHRADRKSTRLNSSHPSKSRMPSSA